MTMRAYADQTQQQAVGSVNREWKQMARLALTLRQDPHISPTWAAEQELKFTGIYKRLLEDPIEDVIQAAKLYEQRRY